MASKGILNKEILPTGNLMSPKASILGILSLAVAVAVLLAAYKLGVGGFNAGRGLLGGLMPAAKGGAEDIMQELDL